MSQFDIALLPSRNDNYPISLLEAFSAKVPVIVSDAGGFREVVKDKINGFIFSKENVNELQDIIDTVLNNPEIINKMKEKIEPVKTIEKNAKEYLDIFNKLIN